MGRSIIAFQQIASLGNNVTLGIVAGISMKVSSCPCLAAWLPARPPARPPARLPACLNH